MTKYALTLLLLFFGIISVGTSTIFIFANAVQTNNCTDISFCWAHVYDPNRLEKQQKQTFITVTGTVHDDPKSEPDGDTHFVLALDPSFAYLSKQINCQKTSTTGFDDVALVQAQGQGQIQPTPCNLIIVEIICHNPIDSAKFPNPAKACGNYHSSEIMTPKYNQYLSVSGSYVFDKDHGDWAEIHPVFKIDVK